MHQPVTTSAIPGATPRRHPGPLRRADVQQQPRVGTFEHMDDNSAAIKDPDDWVTGDEPETAAQRSYLETLSREAGEDPPGPLTKADAAKHIEALQKRTGRGR